MCDVMQNGRLLSFYLMYPMFTDITSDKVIEQILQRAESDNPRIRNLAKVFLEDYCTPEQVQCVKASQDTQHN